MDGTPEERECDNGLHFNMDIKQCDRPQRAGCIKSDVDFDCDAQDPQLDPPLYADPEDCHSFIACAGGLAQRIPCAEGTSWNQDVQNCVVGEASCKPPATTANKRRW